MLMSFDCWLLLMGVLLEFFQSVMFCLNHTAPKLGALQMKLQNMTKSKNIHLAELKINQEVNRLLSSVGHECCDQFGKTILVRLLLIQSGVEVIACTM